MSLGYGAVLTSSELEGVSDAADWSRWITSGRAPDANTGAGFRVSWADDLAHLRDLGMDEVLVTLEWARLEPTPGHYDQEEIEHLERVLGHARSIGLKIWACLIDGTLPGWFAHDERGFIDDRSRQLLWPRHVEWIGERFGHLVDGWVPQREPIHQAVRNNLLAMGPPGHSSPDDTAKAVRAAVLADGEAVRVLKGSSPIATYQTVRMFVPEIDNVRAAPHAMFLDDLLRSSWIRALIDGQVEVADQKMERADHLRDGFDRAVLQLRPPVAVDGDGLWSPADTGFLFDGLVTALDEVIDQLPETELVVAADLAPVDDDGSAQSDHLRALFDAAHELGANGWWQSSPIDGWHWERGFDNRSGIIATDRSEKTAATVFQ